MGYLGEDEKEGSMIKNSRYEIFIKLIKIYFKKSLKLSFQNEIWGPLVEQDF